MWLTQRLMPDHKTVSEFRKDNGKAIVGVCREFVGVCRRLELFTQAVVAIDGSKFKAVNHRDKNFTEAKMTPRQKRVEKSIARWRFVSVEHGLNLNVYWATACKDCSIEAMGA